jgi:serine protease Do
VAWRDGREVPLTITTVSVPKLAAQAERMVLSEFGLVVREIVLDDRFAMCLSKEEAGVLCENVAPATRAGDAGLRPGDVVKRLNEEAVRDIQDFRRVFRHLSEERPDEIFLRVLRGGRDTLVCRMEPRWESLPVESGEE